MEPASDYVQLPSNAPARDLLVWKLVHFASNTIGSVTASACGLDVAADHIQPIAESFVELLDSSPIFGPSAQQTKLFFLVPISALAEVFNIADVVRGVTAPPDAVRINWIEFDPSLIRLCIGHGELD